MQRPRRNVELNKRGEVGRLVEGKKFAWNTLIFYENGGKGSDHANHWHCKYRVLGLGLASSGLDLGLGLRVTGFVNITVLFYAITLHCVQYELINQYDELSRYWKSCSIILVYRCILYMWCSMYTYAGTVLLCKNFEACSQGCSYGLNVIRCLMRINPQRGSKARLKTAKGKNGAASGRSKLQPDPINTHVIRLANLLNNHNSSWALG